MSTDPVLRRWTGRLSARRALLAAARKRHEWQHNAQSRAILVKRKAQVAFAERVVARHGRAHLLAAPPALIAFIATWEGGQSRDGLFHPYWDKAGRVWTIGYGHTAGVTGAMPPLTKAQAFALLGRDIGYRYAPLVDALHLPLTTGQRSALISVVYNLGPGYIQRGHTLGDALFFRNWKAAADAILLYDKAGNPPRRLPGLTARRIAERAMFTKGTV